MKLPRLCVLVVLSVTPLGLHAMSAAPSIYSGALVEGTSGPVSQFTLNNSTQIPGQTLKAGAYTIRILDHLSDRMVIRVEDRKGKTKATFLALPSSGLGSSGRGPIDLGSGAGAKAAMRGFSFDDGTTAEFVYPKAEAVGLAKANGTKIVAIDPRSEGRPEASKLSSDDLQMVTLWMLSPTTVGPDNTPGIAAERYHAPHPAEAARVKTVDTANQVASSQAHGGEQGGTQASAAEVPARPVRKAKPVMAVLPHTASNLPAVEVTGLLALAGAMLLRSRRRLSERS